MGNELTWVIIKLMAAEIPTMKEIAKKLGISTSSVSRALHNHPSIGLRTRMRVNELAKELDYELNQTAIFFHNKKTFTVGVILPQLTETFFSEAISGIEDIANKNKYTVLVGQSHNNEEREKAIIQTMKEHRVDGFIISISKNTTHYEHFEMLKKHNIPMVFFDCIPQMKNINTVECNIETGTIKAVTLLLKKGYRIIGLINGPERLLASKQRLDGYKLAIHKHRLKYDPNLVINTDLTTIGTQNAMLQLLKYKRVPTAILTFNDYVALDAVQYARKNNVMASSEISFVSFANLPSNCYTSYPPIASIEQFPYQQGQKSMETLLQILADPKKENNGLKTIIEPQLVVNDILS